MSSKFSYTNDLSKQLLNFLNDDVLLESLNNKNINYDICFDCNLWNYGITYVNSETNTDSLVIPPLSQTFIEILTQIELFLKEQLCNFSCSDFGYKSQLERLLCLIVDLKSKVSAIRCVDTCNDMNILSILLSTLIQTILLLLSILEHINALSTYGNSCGCTSVKLSEILIGKLINNITQLQVLLQDWYAIVMTFLYHSSTSTKSYVASYVPKQPIHIPTPNFNMSHACVPCPPKPQPCPPVPPNLNCTPFPY